MPWCSLGEAAVTDCVLILDEILVNATRRCLWVSNVVCLSVRNHRSELVPGHLCHDLLTQHMAETTSRLKAIETSRNGAVFTYLGINKLHVHYRRASEDCT